jgi:hypothetical protein
VKPYYKQYFNTDWDVSLVVGNSQLESGPAGSSQYRAHQYSCYGYTFYHRFSLRGMVETKPIWLPVSK